MAAKDEKSTGLENLAPITEFCRSHTDTYPSIDPLRTDLSGKSVVITGASKGIGRATAISFAKAGCSRIAISARSDLSSLETELRSAAKEAGRAEPIIVSTSVDVSNEDDIIRFADVVGKAFEGKVDVLINNAGYLEKFHQFGQTVPSEWWRTWEVNIKGLYLCSRYFMPLVLAPSSLKLILNVSSMGAHVVHDGGSGYQSTKFAVCRITEFMQRDHWDEGLVAVALHPGSVKTDLAAGLPESLFDFLTDTVKLPADWMVWFCRERREWLGGRYLSVNWDVDELEAKKEMIVEKDLLKFRMALL